MIPEDPLRFPKLYFNLANAYLQSGSLGRAIANYERAERLMPGDRAVATNLHYAQSLLPDANATAAPPSVCRPEASSLKKALKKRTVAMDCVATISFPVSNN